MTLETERFYSIKRGSFSDVFYIIEVDEEKVIEQTKGWVKVIDVVTASISWRAIQYLLADETLTKHVSVHRELDAILSDKVRLQAIVNNVKTLATYVKTYKLWQDINGTKDTEIKALKERIRELEFGKFDVLEVDQWTSTGDIEKYPLDTFDVSSIHGGDADTIRKLGINYAEIRTVFGDQSPSIGKVWFKEEKGKLKLYKYNYDSSD